MLPAEVDFNLIAAWLSARSIARDAPQPFADRGGLRVDTNSVDEVRRWVFPHLVDGVCEIGRNVDAPRHFLRVCTTSRIMRETLTPHWRVLPLSYVMTADRPSTDYVLPDGYRVECAGIGAKTHIRIVAPDGDLAASGYAVETTDVFIYDRIRTEAGHQRLGLGSALMAALGATKRSPTTPHILVATTAGRKLYARLGWTIYSPYASAVTR